MYKSMTRKLPLFILSAAAMLSLCSCADTEPPKSADNTGVSSIPWDRPEKWETGSQIPGAELMNSQ